MDILAKRSRNDGSLLERARKFSIVLRVVVLVCSVITRRDKLNVRGFNLKYHNLTEQSVIGID